MVLVLKGSWGGLALCGRVRGSPRRDSIDECAAQLQWKLQHIGIARIMGWLSKTMAGSEPLKQVYSVQGIVRKGKYSWSWS